MIDVHARLIRNLEQVAGLNRDDRVSARATTRSTSARSTTRGSSRPELAVMHGLLQDPPVHGAARVRPARRTSTSRTTSSATSPPCYPSATRRRCAAIGCGARSSPRSSPTSSSTAPGRRSRSGSRRRPARPPPLLARGYAVAREVFEMRTFWAAIEELDNPCRGRHPAADADRGAPAGRACDPVAGARRRRRDRHRRDDRATSSRARGCSPRRCPTCSTARTASASRAIAAELRDASVPDALARRVAAMPTAAVGVRHRRGGGSDPATTPTP